MTSCAHCILVVVVKLPGSLNDGGKRSVRRCQYFEQQKAFSNNLNRGRCSWGIFKGKENWTVQKRWVEALVETQRGECIWNSYATTSKVTFKCVQFFSIPASLSLNFLLIFYFRVKDYISSGLHNKVIDPDGGIHSNKKQFEKTWRLPVFKVMMTLQYPIPHRVTPMTSI